MNIVQAIVTAVGYVTTIIITFATFWQKKTDKGKIKVLEYDYKVNEVLSKTAGFVKQAEDIFGSGTGQAKLLFVKTQLHCEALRRGVEVDDEVIEKKIKEVLIAPQEKQCGGGSSEQVY